MKPTLLVLAAGMGSRYKGLKQVDPFGPSGETILEYAVYDAARAGFGKVVFILRKDIEERFKELFFEKISSHIEVDYALQDLHDLPGGYAVPEGRTKPWGTGQAVLAAAKKIDTPFAVINADDFYGAGAFEMLARGLEKMPAGSKEFFLAGYQLSNTLSDYGHVSRGICKVDGNGLLQDITERTKIYRNNGKVVYEENGETRPLTGNETVSMNLFGFPPSIFAEYRRFFEEFLASPEGDPLKREFYIPTVVNNLVHANEAQVKVLVEVWVEGMEGGTLDFR